MNKNTIDKLFYLLGLISAPLAYMFFWYIITNIWLQIGMEQILFFVFSTFILVIILVLLVKNRQKRRFRNFGIGLLISIITLPITLSILSFLFMHD